MFNDTKTFGKLFIGQILMAIILIIAGFDATYIICMLPFITMFDMLITLIEGTILLELEGKRKKEEKMEVEE